MAGTFTSGETKVRPGLYFRTKKRGGVQVVGAINGVLACMFQSNWGPLNKQFEMDSSMANNVVDYYGTGEGTEIITEGFIGGATTIRAVRVGGDDGTNSKIILQNTDGNDVVIIQAAYPGDRAFTVSVRTNLVTGARQCVIYDGTEIFEQYSFEAGSDEPSALVEAMEMSKNFDGVLAAPGASGSLAAITQKQMDTGTNPTVTVSSYSKATDVLERYDWNCLICDSNDAGVHAIIESFVEQSYNAGHFGFGCIAGTHKQDLDSRMTGAASINDEKMVYVLHGWTNSSGKDYEGYLAAARIGGMVAAVETNSSLTHDVIKGAVSLIEPLTNGELIKAEKKGCLVFDTNSEDQIWIDAAINTLVTPDDNQDEGWKKIRRTKTRFELMQRVDDSCAKLVGKVNNDTNGRQTIMATAQKVINAMVGEDKLMSGSNIVEDPTYTAEGDSCWFLLEIWDIDSAEKIYLTYEYSFAQDVETE